MYASIGLSCLPLRVPVSLCRRGWAAKALFAFGLLVGSSAAAQDVSVTYAFGEPALDEGGAYARVSVAACAARHQIGKPQVPCRTGRILLPAGAKVEGVAAEALEAVREVKVSKPLDFGRTPLPIGVQDHPSVAAAALDRPDAAIYGADAAYPASRAELVSVQKMNGYSIAIVRIYPVQYQPASGTLLFCPRLKVTDRKSTRLNSSH